MVTKIKSSDVIKKTKVIAPKSTPKARSPRRPAAAKPAVEEAVYTEAHAETRQAQQSRQSADAKRRISHMVARGKDLVSGDATSVATAAAIVVGAALIEVELIPGLIIGAGAMLLSKLFPEMSGYVRPAIKGALRAGFVMAQKAQELMAETSEQVHDLVAEVMLEQKHPHASKAPVTEPANGNLPKA